MSRMQATRSPRGKQPIRSAFRLPIVAWGAPIAVAVALVAVTLVALALPSNKPIEPVTLATPPPPVSPVIEEAKVLATAKARVVFPIVTNLPSRRVQDAVNARVEREFGLQDMLSFARDMERESPDGSWEIDFGFSAEVIGDVLHLRGLRYTFAGGAHGDTQKCDVYIDARSGEFYAFDQLFRNYEIANAVIGDFIANEMKKHPEETFPDANPLPLPSLYTFTPEGVCLEYPPYRIAPYSSGFVSYLVPKEMLLSLIEGSGRYYRALLGV